MSPIQGLRVLVKQFLSAAADEIVEAVEKIIAGYEEEMFQSKREITRQRMHEIRSNRISEEAQLNLSVWEEDFLTEQQQEWNSSPRQKTPESPQTERSHKEPLSGSQDRRPEDDTMLDTFTPVCVKEEEEEVPLPVTSAEQMPIETDEEVPSPGLCEPENGGDDDWYAAQDGDADRSEEWTPSEHHPTLTALKTPRTKKRQRSCFVCKVCGKSFQYEGSLVNHLESHPKDLCGLCGTHLETEDDFELHLKTHAKVKARVCDVCGKRFAKPFHLEEHMRSHEGEKAKPFRCEECGRFFSRHQNMARHLRSHTEEKSYSCNTCGKSFTSYYLLKQHMVDHIVTSRIRTRVSRVESQHLND